jgi:hypothetical protein
MYRAALSTLVCEMAVVERQRARNDYLKNVERLGWSTQSSMSGREGWVEGSAFMRIADEAERLQKRRDYLNDQKTRLKNRRSKNKKLQDSKKKAMELQDGFRVPEPVARKGDEDALSEDEYQEHLDIVQVRWGFLCPWRSHLAHTHFSLVFPPLACLPLSS